MVEAALAVVASAAVELALGGNLKCNLIIKNEK